MCLLTVIWSNSSISNNSIKHKSFVCIQFKKKWNSCIWFIGRILSGAAISGRSGPGSDSSERGVYIPQIFKSGALLSDGLMPYPGQTFGEGSYPSAEMISGYSTTPADLADAYRIFMIRNFFFLKSESQLFPLNFSLRKIQSSWFTSNKYSSRQ